MMVAIFILGLWLTMTAARSTPIGRALREWMVERPAARLARLTRGHVVLMLSAAAMVGAAEWIGGDAIRILGMATPDLAAWAITFDIATYADLAIMVALASSTMRLRGAGVRIVAVVRRTAMRHRRARKGPRPARPTPANDDEDGRPRIAA